MAKIQPLQPLQPFNHSTRPAGRYLHRRRTRRHGVRTDRVVVDGVITIGLGILAGAPKAGKSWLAYAVALALASGGKVLGSVAVRARPVPCLALEDSKRRLYNRRKAIFGPGSKNPPGLSDLPSIPRAKRWGRFTSMTRSLAAVSDLVKVPTD